MKKLLAMLMAIVMVFSLVACGKDAPAANVEEPEKAETPEKVENAEAAVSEETLTMWISSALLSITEGTVEESEWLINKLARSFEDQNPGVKVNIILQPDPGAIHQMFKAAYVTEESPDIVQVYAGNNLFELEEIVHDLTSLIPAEDKEQIAAWDSVSLNMEVDGKVLAYPTCGKEAGGFFYNREVLAACGLDYDNNPPATLDQFLKDLDTIKAAGYLPIYATDNGWSHSFLCCFAAWWPQVSGSARVASNGNGTTKFADDQGFLDMMDMLAKLYADGMINQDYASATDDTAEFVIGNAAFLASLNAFAPGLKDALGEENVGFMAPPSKANAQVKNAGIGGVGQALCVSKTCENPELAVKFLSFLSSKESHMQIVKNISMIPFRTDITAEEMGITAGSLDEMMFNAAANYVFWVDNTLHPDVAAEMGTFESEVITGQMSTKDFADLLDAKAAEVN